MLFLYNLLLYFLYPIYLILSLSKKGKKFHAIRNSEILRLASITPKSGKNYWFHAASVGELDQCKAIIQVVRKNEPDSNIYQSVFSDSVSEKSLNDPLFDFSFHLPLDFYHSYHIYFQTLKPDFLIISAWDTWPNLLRKAQKLGVKTILANGTIHKNSGRFRFPIKYLSRASFSMFTAISPASSSLISLFQEFTKTVPILCPGDSRFDSVIQKIESKKSSIQLPPLDKPIIILASTYSYCENILIPGLRKILEQGFRIWIFPHKVDSIRIGEVSETLEKSNLEYAKYSEDLNSQKDIILMDKIGILAFAYEHALYAYVGGAFHHRIHNVIEPAYFGLPILCGPKKNHAQEALGLEEIGGLFVFETTEEFLYLHEKITEKKKNLEIRKINSDFVQKNKGYSERFYKEILRKENL